MHVLPIAIAQGLKRALSVSYSHHATSHLGHVRFAISIELNVAVAPAAQGE